MLAAGDVFTMRDHIYVGTAPATLGGRYLRQFWQPVYHTADLEPGRATPLRVMSADFTLYRGESGAVFLIDPHCPHRAAQMSIGRIEGDAIRCFYHGWKFGAGGVCSNSPPRAPASPRKSRSARYPTREYLGLIFAFLGEGEPPEFPRYRGVRTFRRGSSRSTRIREPAIISRTSRTRST